MTDAVKQDAWREVVSRARPANLLAFAEKGVAVLDQELGGEGPETALLWDELLCKAERAKILKFRANGILVLVW